MENELALELADTEHKAWDALSRYKFWMFGYWAVIWVHLNRISGVRRPNPWKDLVLSARSRPAGQLSDSTTNFAVYQIADDQTTYGPDSGKFIVTSADHELEFSGPMSEKDARAYAVLLEALTDAERFIRGFEGDELQEGIDELLTKIRAALPSESIGRVA